MTPGFLEATRAGERERQEALLGVSIPSDWPDETHWLETRVEQLRREPDLLEWLSRAIVLRRERRMIGNIGFHARPGAPYLDGLVPGGVEFGYTIFEGDRRRGYAREACVALMDWAQRIHGVTRFVLSIGPDNAASLALARGLGFERIGSHVDERDGPEDVFERRVGGEPSSARSV
jgi:RimJ/RimL family protein N-acetyltransferase